MSGLAWAFAALLLTVAAVVAAWPARTVLRRLDGRRRIRWRGVDVRRLWSRIQASADGSPRRAVGAAVLACATVGLLSGGPVAGVVLALYGALGARATIRRASRRRAAAARSRSLDDLNALAADLRAGLAVSPAQRMLLAGGRGGPAAVNTPPVGRPAAVECPPVGRPAAVDDPLDAWPAAVGNPPGAAVGNPPDARLTAVACSPDARLGELTAAVWRLAEQTGAPAADLIERIEADARAGDRARATAAAQAAGARATALLLAALPIGGLGLGYGIGADPLQVLLHTGLGGGCAVAAVLLQCAGLIWSDRLANGPAR